MNKKDDDKAKINIFKDVFGAGEFASSLSESYNKTIDDINIKTFPPGVRFFIFIMFIVLIALIVIPFLKIEAFANFPFDVFLGFWFCCAFLVGGIFVRIEIIKKKSKK